MKCRIGAALLVLGPACASGTSPDLPFEHACDAPVVESFVREGREVRATRKHCVDRMGPNADGYYEFIYVYDLYEFALGSEILHARSYDGDTQEAHFLAIERDGKRSFLSRESFAQPLGAAALGYLRGKGKTDLTFLDRANEQNGYSPVP